jgi:hypothetical protein
MTLILFLAAQAPAGTQTIEPGKKLGAGASAHFDKGKELIENNCIDCMGGTQEGMEQGIREVEAALQAGYRNRKAAYELLSDAFGYMTTYTGKNPDQEKAYTTRRQQIDRRLFEMYPEDPDALQRYETSLDVTPENESERMKVLRQLVKIKPTPDSKFGLGMLLMKQANVNEGMLLVRSAIMTQGDPEAVMNYVGRLVEQLDELGCPLANAASWNEKVYAAWDKTTRGAGDPKALPDFKRSLSLALERVTCTSK